MRLQSALTFTVIGSKKMNEQEKTAIVEKLPNSLIVEIKTSEGNIIGTMMADQRTFSTGSVGFYGYGKLNL